MHRLPLAALACGCLTAADVRPPNIVYVLADDFGWGDTTMNNERSKIPTPNLDRLARSGMRFTDAHAAAAVCTPTRYGLMTGRYPFRNANRGLLLGSGENGPDGLMLIPENRPTVASLLRGAGYRTTLVGKWHLGWNWPALPQGTTWEELLQAKPTGKHKAQPFDFRKSFANGPTARGFDSYFGINMPSHAPYAFIQDDRVVGELTTYRPYERFGAETPGAAIAGWEDRGMMPAFTQRCVELIAAQAQQPAQQQPFFLFFSMTSPHYPIAPAPEYVGTSGINAVADFVIETDARLGQVLDAIDRAGLADRTLVIFATDNGHDGTGGAVRELAAAGHAVSGPYAGLKRDIKEGGHRVPCVARWPGVVPAGSVCDETISLNFLMATCADITGAALPETAAEDSFSILPLLRGEQPAAPTHPLVICESGSGQLAVIRDGWTYLAPPFPEIRGGMGGNSAGGELYRVGDDPGQQRNLAAEHPQRVAELHAALAQAIADGRTRPGPPQRNDVEIRLPGTSDVR